MITETSSPVAVKLCSPRVVLPMLAAISLLAVIVVLIQMDAVEFNPPHHHKPSPIQRKLRNVQKKKDCFECKAQVDKLKARIADYQKHVVELLKANQVLQEKFNDTLSLIVNCVRRSKPAEVTTQDSAHQSKPDKKRPKSKSNHTSQPTPKKITKNSTTEKTKVESKHVSQSANTTAVQKTRHGDDVKSRDHDVTSTKTTKKHNHEKRQIEKLKSEDHSTVSTVSWMSDHDVNFAYREERKRTKTQNDLPRNANAKLTADEADFWYFQSLPIVRDWIRPYLEKSKTS